MIQSAKENAAKRKKAGGKSIREAALAADAEKLRERGRLIDGDSDWSPLRRTPEELAAEIEQQKAPELIDAAVAEVVVTKANPRTLFDEEALAELAASLREQGLIQPITVRRVAGGSLELIAGERRLRAAKRLGWTSIKAIVQPLDDVQAVEARAVENIVRENLNAIETAVAYRQMMEATGESQAQLAKRLGCSQPKIAHAVALLKLPEIWKARLIAGEVNASDARTLAPWVNRPKVLEAFDEVWTADQKDAKSYQEPPQEFEFLLGEAVNEATEPLAGHDFHRGKWVTWKIDPAKLDDATRESLDVFEFNRQTRAANTELLYQLALAAKDAEWEKAEKKDRKAQAKLDKKAGITPDVERAAPVGSAPAAPLNPNAAAEREKQLRRHVEEWRTNWLRKIIDKAMPIGVARRLFHWAWAELSSNHSSYDAQFGAFSLTARGELFREIASESSKSRKSWLATTAPWPAKKLDEFEFAVAHRLLTLNGEAVPHVPPALVEELAEELEIDEDARWEWTPDFLNLFRIPELEELVDELKLDVSVAGFTKKALVSTIVAKAPKRQRPKLLVAIAKAARKGGKS